MLNSDNITTKNISKSQGLRPLLYSQSFSSVSKQSPDKLNSNIEPFHQRRILMPAMFHANNTTLATKMAPTKSPGKLILKHD
jgi:hypothetical protein